MSGWQGVSAWQRRVILRSRARTLCCARATRPRALARAAASKTHHYLSSTPRLMHPSTARLEDRVRAVEQELRHEVTANAIARGHVALLLAL